MTTPLATRPQPAYSTTPSTNSADMTLRVCRAERRVEVLAAAIRLLCDDDDATTTQRRAAALVRGMLDDVAL